MTPETKKTVAAPRARHRSPNYPGINLKAAVDKITAWYKADGLVATPREAALKHMGFDKFTSEAGRILSALKSFGLTVEADGRIKLTQRGVEIVARPAEDPKRQQALRDAAVGPSIYKTLLKEYSLPLPSDTTLQSELITSKGFNPKSIKDFLRDFRASIEFASISNDAMLDLSKGEDCENDEQSALREGDFVQWESQGILQFSAPRRITGFSEDAEWAFVEGSNTGVPVKELLLEKPPAPATNPLVGQLTPEQQRSQFALGKMPTPSAPGIRQDIFSLGEGTVTIQWPASISAESFEDVSAWLDILKRKIGRSVMQKEESAQ